VRGCGLRLGAYLRGGVGSPQTRTKMKIAKAARAAKMNALPEETPTAREPK
jgi:hypothetical protein